MEDEPVEVAVLLTFDASLAGQVISDLELEDFQLTRKNVKGISPVMDVLLTTTLAMYSGLNFFSTLMKRLRRGIIVEDQGDQIVVRQDDALPRGVTVVRGPAGEIQIREDEGTAEKIMGALSQLAKKAGS